MRERKNSNELIRRVSKQDYFVYDFLPDMKNYRKRLYGRTEKELLEKVELEKEKRMAHVQNDVNFILLIEYWLNNHCEESSTRKNSYLALVKSFADDYVSNTAILDVTADEINNILSKNGEVMSYKNQMDLFVVLKESCAIGLSLPQLNMKVKVNDIIEPIERDLLEIKKTKITEEMLVAIEEEAQRNKYGESSFIVLSFIHAGITSAEACNLTWDCIQDGYIVLPQRKVPMDDFMVDLLENKVSHRSDKYVFSTQNANPITESAVLKTLKSILNNQCLNPRISPRDLRVEYGRRLVKKGISTERIAELLGYKTILTINNYYIYDMPNNKTTEEILRDVSEQEMLYLMKVAKGE